MEFELVIQNGTVIDGTGAPRFRADIGIRGGRIAAVSSAEPLNGAREIDASDLVIAPGFIDFHSHSDWILPLADHDEILAPLVQQGMTTMVAGACGFSPAPVTDASLPLIEEQSEMLREDAFEYRWHSMAEFLDAMDSQGVLLNTAMLVGHSTLRYAVMGDRPDYSTPEELDALCYGARRAVREGAFGLSAGLGYTPGMFANNDELQAMIRTVGQEGGIYAVHNRTYRWMSPFYKPLTGGVPHNIRSIREQLDLAGKAKAKLQFSHLIFVGRNTWDTYKTALDDIERAAEDGLDVAFDAFPYTYGNTTIKVNFPKWFLIDLEANLRDAAALDRLEAELDSHAEMVGRGYADIYLLWAGKPELAHLEGADFATIADHLGVSPFTAYVTVARESDLKARILQDTFSGDAESEVPLRAVLSHPLCAFMLDTILTTKGIPNPASLGTFPRILGKYSRDLGLFSLEEAVRRMTSFSADRIGLKDLGRVAEGSWADLVLFDPQTVADKTTLRSPDTAPTGIKSVLISGQVVAQDGRLVNEDRHGRVLRS